MTPAAMDHGAAGSLATSVDPAVAAVSLLAAIVAAFVALELAGRALRSPGRARRRWLVASGLVMGGGIWSMHFLAMLGIRTGMAMSYRLDLVVLSVLFAALGATIALALVAHPAVSRPRVVVASAFMGLAVSAMHYTGMASMEAQVHMTWDLPLVGLSMTVAFVASFVALSAVVSMHAERSEWTVGGRLAASVALGVAVAGLHYVGMAAVTFHPDASLRRAGVDLGTSALVTVLGAGASVLLLVVTLDGSRQKRRAEIANDLAVVANVSRQIGRRGDARRAVCTATRELLDCDFVVLLEAEGDGAMAVSASSDDGGAHLGMRLDGTPGRSVSGEVLSSGRSRFVADVRGAPGADVEGRRRTGVVSMLLEPVVLDDRSIGVLVAGWRTRISDPGVRARSFLGLLAAEAAVAIERADLVAQLREQALVDGLTGLPNRRALDEALDAGVRRVARTGEPLTVAMVDVDRFKDYNDTYGHPEGDRVLAEIAAAWRAELRGNDIVGRFGGEEFLLLLPGVDSEVASRVIDRLRGAMPTAVTCSFGVATWNGDEDATALVARADGALYRAKAEGRDRIVVG